MVMVAETNIQRLHTMGFRSDRLRELRKGKKYTQGQLAKIANSSQSNVSAWETGSYSPSSEELLALSDEFKVSVDYLLGLTDEPKGILLWSDLDEDERALLTRYHESDPIIKTMILKILDAPLEAIQRLTRPVNKPTNLLNDGRKD